MQTRLALVLLFIFTTFNLVKSCNWDQFQCDNGDCTTARYQCDGGKDCSDGTDELNCICTNGPSCYQKPESTCNTDQFRCTSGACIPPSWVCDGDYDCADLSDEHSNCEKLTCAPFQFTCDNGACIDAKLKCNTRNDCGDNSDEIICQIHLANDGDKTRNRTDCGDAFSCKDGSCVLWEDLCNGIYNCPDRSDEDGKCKEGCEKLTCDHGTRATPSGCVCTCRMGYRLAGDGLTCVDAQECANDPPVCAQLCMEGQGTYYCGCFNEFVMRYDNTSCKSQGQPMTIYFGIRNEIRRYTPSQRNLHVMHQAIPGEITNLDMDITNNVIYYSVRDNNSLSQFFLNNNTQKSITNVGEATHISLDWITKNVYFVVVQNKEEFNYEAKNYQIRVCHFGRRHCAAILNTKRITALTIDAINKKLFIAINENASNDEIIGHLYSSSLDGVYNQPIATFNATITDMIADYRRQHVYIVKENSIDRIGYNGQHLVNIVEAQMAIRGLNIFEDHLYFLTAEGLTMHRCRLFGDARRCTSFRLSADATTMFVIAQNTRQTPGRDVCVNYNCSQLCVPSGRDGASCFCENGQIVDEHSDCRE